MKPSRWLPLAVKDVEEATEWFAHNGGMSLELSFIDALKEAVEMLERHPGAGSPRHGAAFPAADGPIRFHPVRGFDNTLIYYRELPDHLQVIRIWDARRGLHALLSHSTDPSS